jgi:phospholipase C
MAYVGLDKFYADAAAGTLPQVSYIIGPAELSEHPPYQPRDGAWLQRKVVEAVVNGKNYKNTALIISYDGKYNLILCWRLLISVARIWWSG